MCTDRGNEVLVPFENDINMLHQTQKVEEASTEEQRRALGMEVTVNGGGQASPGCSALLLVNALPVGIPQQSPVLPYFNQTLDTITHLQIFVFQTLLETNSRGTVVRWSANTVMNIYRR